MTTATLIAQIDRLTALDRARIEYRRTIQLFQTAHASLHDVVAARDAVLTTEYGETENV